MFRSVSKEGSRSLLVRLDEWARGVLEKESRRVTLFRMSCIGCLTKRTFVGMAFVLAQRVETNV